MQLIYAPATATTMDETGHWRSNGWSGPENSMSTPIPEGSDAVRLDSGSIPTLRQFSTEHECVENLRQCCHYMLHGDGEYVFDEKHGEIVRAGMCNCGGIRVRRANSRVECFYTHYQDYDIPGAYDPDSLEYAG